ncbi:NAD(P)-binding Rossmann-fold superfamily protein [Striga hermonthica]|uniref:NAD(P)-binding Rossmann-fold superfamily protein n=1 Tax=Striga hermonthica TaxID=68872 RepID=A0A9N7P196_STRHE|nr:NAD(P)-binding Rossmann-fold superfamily protein [Striga hermonthica]
MASESTKTAAIFGVTGLVGRELARALLSSPDWNVYGIARRPDPTTTTGIPCADHYHFISCDLLSPSDTLNKLSPALKDVTHVFWVTWASRSPLDSSDCHDHNRAMLANALDAILPTSKGLRHVSLQTGTKHYISFAGPTGGGEEARRYSEESPRVESTNFYYALEDLLRERLLRAHNVGWSIHRPGLILGCSSRTLFNFMGSVCVYGAVCKYLNLPFVFRGTRKCWEEMHVDMSDARLVAEQHIWASTSEDPGVANQAFNVTNGEDYTWREIWAAIGARLGVDMTKSRKGEDEVFTESGTFCEAMGDKGGVWKKIVEKEGLVEVEMGDLANWGFLDMLFRCPVKMLASREKGDVMGFKKRCRVLDSIFYWIDVMRADKLIP